MNGDSKDFYALLTPLYHLIYPDWDASMQRQAAMLDSIIRETWGTDAHSVLDVSCGIGTEALGLATLGYEVTASDLSPEEGIPFVFHSPKNYGLKIIPSSFPAR